jgi:hypothetical protein
MTNVHYLATQDDFTPTNTVCQMDDTTWVKAGEGSYDIVLIEGTDLIGVIAVNFFYNADFTKRIDTRDYYDELMLLMSAANASSEVIYLCEDTAANDNWWNRREA